MPPIFQNFIDKCSSDGKLRSVTSKTSFDEDDDDDKIMSINNINEKNYVIYNKEKFIVVGFVFYFIIN